MNIPIGAAVAVASLLLPAAAFADTIVVVPGAGNPIQAAFDQAQDGDTIVLTKGSYPGDATLQGKADINVRGSGKPVIDGTLGGDHGLTFDTIAGLGVTGIAFRNFTDDGIRVTDCADVVISKCSFEDIGDIAIEEYACAGFTVTKCRFLTVGAGIMSTETSQDTGTTGIVLTKNALEDVAGRAISVTGPDAIIEGNRILSAGSDGIVVYFGSNARGALVSRNRIDGPGRGISCYGADSVVSKNRVVNCGSTGIELIDTNGGTVEKNAVSGCGGYGFMVQSTGTLIRSNRISESGNKDLGSTFGEGSNTYEENRYETSEFNIFIGSPV